MNLKIHKLIIFETNNSKIWEILKNIPRLT